MVISMVISAAVAAGIAVPAVAAGTASAAPTAKITRVRLAGGTVRKPGKLGVIVRSSGCITDVRAWASAGGATDTVSSAVSTRRGTSFTVYLPFSRSAVTGTWYLTNVLADRCGTKPTRSNPWNVEWDGFDKFTVRS